MHSCTLSAASELAGIRHEVLFGQRVVRCFEQRPRSLWEMFEQSANADPTADALLWEPDGRLSYAELHQRSRAVSARLHALELRAGDRIATLVGNRYEYVVMALAIWRLGAILVPLDIRLQAHEVRHIINHSGCRVLLCAGSLLEALPPPDSMPNLERVIATEGMPPAGHGATQFQELLRGEGDIPVATVREEDPAAILYTSGTTGAPKGVVLAHVNIIHSAMHFERVWQLPKRTRSCLAIPASNVTGLVTIILTMLRIGGCVVIMPPFKASEFLRIAARRRINHAFMVPAQYKLCSMDKDLDRYDLSSWTLGSTGGAPMPAALIEQLQRRIPTLQLSDGYGATELASPAIIRPPALTAAHPDSIGLPVACAEVLVMTEAGTQARVGEPGELWIKGPMVCREYWRDPQATREAFIDGFWKSGDIATMDAQGLFRLHDRKKDIVNRGGYKIYSAEVENVLLQHPLVREVAVIPKPDDVLGERVHAVVFAEQGTDVQDLQALCAAQLADYKVPESFTMLAHPLPRNSNGKIVKRALREQIFAHASA